MRGINFSEAMWRKFGGAISQALGNFWNQQWDERTVTYNVKGEGYTDIKNVFKDTAEGEVVLTNVIKPWIKLSNDSKILKIAEYVNKRLTYTSDKTQYGKSEYWQSPYEIWKRKKDDCDGYAILIFKLAVLAGIPRYRIKVVAGQIKLKDKKISGHCYVQYLKEKNNNWFTIEGSFRRTDAMNRFKNDSPHTDDLDSYGKLWWTTTDQKSFSQNDMKIKKGIK